jgi:hypothetical protein
MWCRPGRRWLRHPMVAARQQADAWAVPRTPQHPSRTSVPEDRPPPQQDRGLGLLIIFTAGALVMVALIVLTAAVDRGWMLIPVIAIDLLVTTAVLASIARLLNVGGDR